jgi:hypothetical protein
MTTPTAELLTNDGVRQFAPLLAADRSDAHASGAVQALVRVVKSGRDLLLDNHSYNLHEAALIASGWSVAEDVREAVLNPPPSALDKSDH